MSNDDITKLADGGVDLRCDGPAASIVNGYGLSARTKLKGFLTDPNRFVAAHSALAEITGVKTGGTIGLKPGRYVANKLNYQISEFGVLSFDIRDNGHLSEWWIDYVGDHTGIQIWDEETDNLVWYNEWKRNVR